jgi:hypothetical protein
MKSRFVYFFLSLIILLQACFFKKQKYINIPNHEKGNYIESIDSTGYTNVGIYNKDKEWGYNTNAAAKYKISKSASNVMLYDLLKSENWQSNIYDTISFTINFNQPDSSFYVFHDKTYNYDLKKYESMVSTVPLLFKGVLTSINGCQQCSIYKFESNYNGGCYDWFFNDSTGFLKTYGPYDKLKTNINDWEIRFLNGTSERRFAAKLLEAIKVDNHFHTRCSAGDLW